MATRKKRTTTKTTAKRPAKKKAATRKKRATPAAPQKKRPTGKKKIAKKAAKKMEQVDPKSKLLDLIKKQMGKGGGTSSGGGGAGDYDSHKARARARQAAIAREGQDIGPLPPPEDEKRRGQCEGDFRAFCETYFPGRFTLQWSADHETVLSLVVRVVLDGMLFALAMPRGSGKTTIFEVAAIWAILYGHRRFVVMIGSSQGAAEDLLSSIMTEIETNELLNADFPEVCLPVRKLEGQRNKQAAQRLDGVRTRMKIKNNRFILPTIDTEKHPWVKSSGGIIHVAGILGRIRGIKHMREDGTVQRPDLVLVEDPQTESSATSDLHIKRRMRVLNGDLLGMKGPAGKPLAALAAVTVIARGDMADQLVDREQSPEWNGMRIPMVKQHPSNEKLLEEYAEVRAQGLRAGDKGKAAATFWKKHQKQLEAGAEVYWVHRFDEGEVSAVQHAVNLRLRNEAAFWAEYQQEPLGEEDASMAEAITPAIVEAKIIPSGGAKRGVVPARCELLTSFIDVQRKILVWMVCGWWQGFGGQIIDYGSWPEQGTMQFSRRSAKRTYAHQKPGAGLDGQIYHALMQCSNELLERDWRSEAGGSMSIARLLVDGNWGKSTNAVYQFAGESPHKSIITPSHGKGVSASMKPLNEYQKKPGDTVGHHWRISSGGRSVRHALYDTNIWKSFIADRLRQALGDTGSISICHATPERHRTLIEQLASEYPVETTGRGRVVDDWKDRPNMENDLWDCLVGCAVAASIAGISTEGHTPSPKKRKRIKLSEIMAGKQ